MRKIFVVLVFLSLKTASSPKSFPLLVYSTFRDSRDLLWMGVENGLVMFQGNRFVAYRYNAKDKNSIIDGRVYAIAEDGKGNIWAATYTNGVSIFNPVKNSYIMLTPVQYPGLLAGRMLNTMVFLGNDTMLINTEKGAYKINTENFGYRSALPVEFDSCNILLYKKHSGSDYFLVQNKGLLEINKAGNERLYTLQKGEMNFMGLGIARSALYVSSFNGLYKYDESTLKKLKLEYRGMDISTAPVNDVLSDNRGDLYVNSNKYGTLKAIDSGNTIFCNSIDESEWYREGNSLYSNYYDSFSRIFFVGTQQGLFIHQQMGNYFKELIQQDVNIGTVRTLLFHQHSLYIGTEGGCFVLKDQLKKLDSDDFKSHKMVFSLFSSRNDKLFGSGTQLFSISHRLNFSHSCNSLIGSAENVTLSYPLNDSIIFILPGNEGEAIYYNFVSNRCTLSPFSRTTNYIYPIHAFKNGFLINSFNGLYFFIQGKSELRKVTKPNDGEISDFKVVEGKVYYSSTTNGIVITDEEFNLIKKIDISKLAGTNEVTAFEILNNVIWFSNESGIGFYKLSDGTAAFFKSGTYFTTNRFLNSSVTRLGDTVYFGGENGVVAVNTKAILAQTEIPKCYLIDVSVYEKGNLLKVEHPDNHTFKYTENNLEIRLVNATTDFSIFKHYQYQLNNNSLIPIDESGMIKLYNLSPDEYQLKVFEIESGTLVCEYKFVISPPWYQTWWFRTLLGMGILANGIWISRLYFKRKLLAQQKEIEKQQALQSERDRISSDMHDDLGSGLSSIKLISEMLKTKHADSETTNDLNEIVQQATGLTDTMREMVWSLNPRNDVLPRFVDHIVRYTRQFLQPTAIALNLKIDPEFPELPMNGFVRRNLFLCLKELLNNIVNHAHAQNVTLIILFNNRQLTISVIDDGIGLGEPIKGGNGLYSLRKRMAECKGDVEWKNTAPGLCTTLRVTV